MVGTVGYTCSQKSRFAQGPSRPSGW